MYRVETLTKQQKSKKQVVKVSCKIGEASRKVVKKMK